MINNTPEQTNNNDKPLDIFKDPIKLGLILQTGIQAALLKHKQMGNPICTGTEDGKVTWIPPEQILTEMNKPPTD